MTHARKGRIWRLDAHGNLLNDCDRAHLVPPYDAVARAIVAAYTQHIPNDIHSIYLTGSVPRGLAVPGQSDMDAFAVLEEYRDPELVMQDWIDAAEDQINAAHTCVNGVQLELWPHGYVFLDPDEFSVGAFIIKTHSLCLWGADLAPELPDYPISPAIANDDIVQIQPDIEEAIDEIEADTSAENVRYWCKRISKNIIRATFGLVMVAEGVHTRDIDLAAAYAIQHYPAQKSAIEQAVAFINLPTDDAGTILHYLRESGAWFIAEADRWLDIHNPERHLTFRLPNADDEVE